ncbi:MAG: aminotransferase class V-fold PLP-dependent enzyme [Chloroflexi bacterium]|nr:MAG: aminotransferase class V-fold PLP-dependent enzyme [Chloroflexota bacterium]TMB76648.1 MAG: aminotransferase class V-fold PLP-dependent enzyme [Chloroflexota bacterium]TMB93050.1 MAG: aminotransferase class V-fold PLP-dependent enzyme [Chloroflexota bacterium]TMC28471.1 MAG: aminotransferase class V-fold PLP-dependent enzyme [Chloroflexota bacterium]TMC56154.1 MAG: aminotransferase class V-fold PLP-dependent enzyme [Chloroflexota bacterium]
MNDMPELERAIDTSPAALQALRGDFLYFNVAGSGPTFPVAARVADRYRTWLSSVGMFSHVGYDAYNAALDATRADLADFIGDPGGATRVALTQSATDALNTLIGGMALPIRMPRKPGSTIVTTAEEHGSALMPTFARRLRGDRVSVLPHRDDPTFLADLRREFADGASALVISLVSCKSGKVLPVTEATRIAHDAGGTVIVDCAQAAGQIPVDVNALGADAYAFLGYKWLHGPLGVGAMWIRDLAKFDVLRMGWRSQTAMDLDGNIKLKDEASRFETGTVDAGAYVGLRQTLAVHRALGSTVNERIRALRARLLERLGSLPFEILSRPADPTGIVVARPKAMAALEIVETMWRDHRIVVKHLSEPGLEAIRISFWALHEDADIDRLAEAFARTLAVRA